MSAQNLARFVMATVCRRALLLLLPFLSGSLNLASAQTPPPPPRSPAGLPGANLAGGGASKEGGQALDVHGQSRNLSMGLLFQKDKDGVTFATPRTKYSDKLDIKQSGF